MGTLHVCFADLPQYGKPTPPIDVSPLATTSNQIETLCELSDAAVDAADSPSAMTQQADPNKDMPPCSLSPGANSAHSTSPTPRYERNISFFHQLSRRFGLLRSSDDPVFSAAEDDSTDSCSSTTGALPPMQRSTGASTTSSLCAPNGGDINTLSSNSNISGKSGAHLHTSNGACLKDGHGSSSEHISCASSETSSTVDIEESQEQQMCSPKADAATATATKLSPTKERRSSARASFSRLQRRSTSSLRRAFESFSLSTRSLSCSGATPTAANTPVNAQQAAQRSGNGNTPIKSALKYNSNVELNRKLQAGGGGGGGGGVIGAWHTSYSASSLQLSSSAAGSSSSSSSSTSKSSSKGKTKPPPQRILRQPVSYTYLKGISGLPTQRVPRSAVCCQYARR